MIEKEKHLIIIAVLILFGAQIIKAQTDSIELNRTDVRQYITQRFPQTRTILLQAGTTLPCDYNIVNSTGYRQEGRLQNHTKLQANINLPVFHIKGFDISTGVSYKYGNWYKKGTASNDYNKHNEYHVVSPQITAGYGTMLFGKYSIFTATAMWDITDRHTEVFDIVLTGTSVIHSSETSTLALGISIFPIHNAFFPVLPIVNYSTMIDKSWMLDCTLPAYVYVRKLLGEKTCVSTGFSLDEEHFYLYPKENMENTCSIYWMKNFIKPKVNIEYRFSKHFHISAEAGYSIPFKGRLYNSKHIFKDKYEIAKYREHPTPYFNISCSYNL